MAVALNDAWQATAEKARLLVEQNTASARARRRAELDASMVAAGLPYVSVDELEAAYGDALVHQPEYLKGFLSFAAVVKVWPLTLPWSLPVATSKSRRH